MFLKGLLMKKIVLMVLFAMMICAVAINASDDKPIKPVQIKIDIDERPVKSYGSAVAHKLVAVEDDFVIRCDVKDWPAVIGRDIPIAIRTLTLPDIVTTESTPNSFFQKQAKKFIQKRLAGAKHIELANITRGKTFSLVADVIVDKENLADVLIEEGLARKLRPGELHPSIKVPTLLVKETANSDTPNKQLVAQPQPALAFIASKSSKIFHTSNCRSARSISDANKVIFATREEAIKSGRRPCKSCTP